MASHGGLTDHERVGDLLVTHALSDEPQDLELAFGERIGGRCLFRLRCTVQLLQDHARDSRMQHRFAAVSLADGLQHVLRRGVLEQVSEGASFERRKDIFFGGVAG